MQGHSLEPVLNEDQASVRDYVLIEDDIADITAKLTPFPGKTRTLLSEHYRYTRNVKGEEQLFDLQADADEMHDLKSSNQELRMHMLDKLAQALIEADDAARGAPVAG